MSEITHNSSEITDNFEDEKKRVSSAVPNAAMRATLIGTPETVREDNQNLMALAAYLKDESIDLSPKAVEDFNFADPRPNKLHYWQSIRR